MTGEEIHPITAFQATPEIAAELPAIVRLRMAEASGEGWIEDDEWIFLIISELGLLTSTLNEEIRWADQRIPDDPEERRCRRKIQQYKSLHDRILYLASAVLGFAVFTSASIATYEEMLQEAEAEWEGLIDGG